MKNKIGYVILLIFFLADLTFISREDLHFFRFFTKPLLIPLITAIHLSERKNSGINSSFLAGLIFSFLGDVFLLFDWGFLPGLGSFMLAHVLYIVSFAKLRIAKMLVSVPFILVYLAGLLYFLYPHLNEMKIPVFIYGTVISTMLYFSLCSKNSRLIAGAFLFVISDTLLAINLFVSNSVITELLVMITYVAAQLLLVLGMINPKK
ncbi:YhhN-like protein [compost metagenome]